MATAYHAKYFAHELTRQARPGSVDRLSMALFDACVDLNPHQIEAAFVAKLNDCEGEATETQTWIEFRGRCDYLSPRKADELDERYEKIIAQLVKMIANPKAWVIRRQGDGAKGRQGE